MSPAAVSGISGAMLNATENDVVILAAGEYTGPSNCDLVINKNNLTLVGKDGSGRVTINCALKSRCLSVLGVTGVKITGITFKNGQAPKTPMETSLRKEEKTRTDVSLPLAMPLFDLDRSILVKEGGFF